MCLCGFKVKKTNTLISTYCPLLLLYAPPFWNDFYKAHHSEKRGVLWLASYSMHCDWPNTSSEVTYGQVWWPILRICALQLTHPKCTHTAVNTHTVNSGQPFMLRRPGSSWGFGALLKGTSVVVLRVERALYIHSPHRQFLPARDSNSQPLNY